MSQRYNKIIKLLFILILVKAIVWALLVPLWHFPDEQAHFGHVAYLAEGGELKRHGKYPDLTEEIYLSEKILGTNRDYQGNNQFTFHPEYRINYSQTINGLKEEEIKSLPLSTRQNFVFKESAYYPHFFYQASSSIYRIFYQSNLFIRVFSLRLFWLSAYLLLIWFVYKIAKLIFPNNLLAVTSIVLLTGFHPMLSFTSAGVTSDNLHNLLFTAVIYFSLAIMAKAKKPRLIDFIGLTLTLSLGLVNKQQFIVAFIIIIPSLVFALIKNKKKILKYSLFLPLVVLIAYWLSPSRMTSLFNLLLKGQIPYLNLTSSSKLAKPGYTLFEHFIFTFKHTIREVLPWYWGVFNWLGVVLPRWVNRVLMRLLVLSGLGLVIYLTKLIKLKKITSQSFYLLFITFVAVVYFISLTIWDWAFMKNNGFSFGIQGRYHFPVIVSHMVLLFFGIKQLAGLFGKFITRLTTLALSAWFIILNNIALYTMADSYYLTSNYNNFIIQASQYKPFFAKGMWLSASLFIYFLLTIYFCLKLTQLIIQNKHEK